MSLLEPLPDLAEVLAPIGEGGRRIAGIDAGEGGAGNISACIGWPIEVRHLFPNVERIEYAEAAARYEYMDLLADGRAEGLTRDERRIVAEAFGVVTGVV